MIVEQWTRERPDIDTSPMAIVARISRLSRLFEQRTGETFASFGLTRSGFAVLAALRRAGRPFELSPTNLYNSLLVSSGAMTYRIDRLEDNGLVKRVPDPNDRRGMLVALTSEGRKLIDQVVSAHVVAEAELLKPLTRAQRGQLAELLRKLAAELESAPDEAS